MEHVKGLLKAINYFGSQKALAQAIHVSQQLVNYWVNCSKHIAYEHVLKIEAYTHGYVTRYELAPDKIELNMAVDLIKYYKPKRRRQRATKTHKKTKKNLNNLAQGEINECR